MASPCLSDANFGPAVSSSCRGGFDFTITFENIVFSLIPSCLFVALAIARLWYLARRNSVVSGGSWFLLTKLGLTTAYSAINFTIVVASSRLGNDTELPTTGIAQALSFVASGFILALTVLEDRRSQRPSFMLSSYLFLSLLFDAVQARTQWLAYGLDPLLPKLHTAALGIKLVLLVAESQKLARRDRSPEESVGLFGIAAYTWLNPLFASGYRNVLSLGSLTPLDRHVESKHLHSKLASALQPRLPHGGNLAKFGLAKALARSLLGPLLLSVPPRLALVGFRFCQPFLVQSLLGHMSSNRMVEATWVNNGYGFIGAAVFIYFGVAVSTALYWYCHERFICMTRGGLVAAIYQSLTQLRTVDVHDSAAVTLMSTDIERIRIGLLNLHEFWGSSVEVALASWLLYRQLGVAFVAPLVTVLVSVTIAFILNKYAAVRQKLWMERIQTRVAETSNMLSSIKQLKISSLAQPVEESTQQLRVDEMEAASKFRRLYVSNMAFGFAPMALCPVITFATAPALDTAEIFTSLAYLVLLAGPLGELFGEIPYLLAALTSLGRIQEFLSKKPQSHGRLFASPSSSFVDSDLELKQHYGPSISIDNAKVGWTETTTVFDHASVQVQPSSLTILAGPVGSGKSTLCKALLTEIPFTDTAVNISAPVDQFRSAFCDQTPYIYNSSIRDNIIGSSPFDKARYREVVDAALLQKDLLALSRGDSTVVGSGGITLSGGQKQRVAIARALYHDAGFYVFDDSLSGLDADTELEVFNRVFGADGVLRRRNATVLFATHNVRHLPSAEHILILGSTGIISYQGDYPGLVDSGMQGLVVNQLPKKRFVGQQDKNVISEEEHSSTPQPSSTQDSAAAAAVAEINTSFLSDKDRMTGDSTVYRYYLSSLGSLSIFAFILFGIGWGFFYNFGYIWLRFWTKDTEKTHSRAHYIGLYAVWQACGLVSIILCYWTSYTMMAKISGLSLHKSALRTVLGAPLSFTTSTDIGVITSLFSQDMTLVDNELPVAITNLALDVCNALGLAAVIATSSPYLAASYPVLVGALYLIQKVYLRTSRQLRLLDLEAKSPLYTHFIDTARGLATIRAFGWTQHSIDSSFRLLDESQKPNYLLAMVQRWLLFVLQCIVAVIAVFVVTLATQTRSETTGFTGASLVALMTFGEILNFIIRWWTQLETSIGAVTRLKSLGDKVPLEGSRDEAGPVPDEWPAYGRVEIRNVSASYTDWDPESTNEKPPHMVLQDLSLSIAPGEKIAICGRSGSGKSSLVLLLLRMLEPLPPNTNNILVDGVGLHSIARGDVRDRIIAMPQDPVFLPGKLSVKQQLDPSGACTEAECHAVLQLVGLSNSVARLESDMKDMLHPESLSGGQKQLFNLARTVLRGRARSKKKTRYDGSEKMGGGILLLDEVSASVDEQTERIMLRVILQEFAKYTIIMVNHRLEMVMDFDRVVVMERGRVVEEGEPKMLAGDGATHFGQLWAAAGQHA
ncbi:ABC transporter [Podospora didyma]|uniref:ABC transporter n=1 Tax=Podospora didyma TaxID=330526 RepID=A0AAE0U169_9PEZI|nr:ABC transporter [Podospora didyma]